MNRIDQELIEAARENNMPEVRRLLSVGADVNAKGPYGSRLTPLHEASDRGHVQVVIELREHGADIEATTMIGMTPLLFACTNGHLPVVNEFLGPNDSNGATTSGLGKRTSRGGANTEAKDHYGNMPLHVVCWEGHLPVVKALVSGGANILAANNNRHLPVHVAVRRGKSVVAKYLLQQMYATTRHLPLHELLKDLTWIGIPNSTVIDVPPLH
jgi:hypothetical protein